MLASSLALHSVFFPSFLLTSFLVLNPGIFPIKTQLLWFLLLQPNPASYPHGVGDGSFFLWARHEDTQRSLNRKYLASVWIRPWLLCFPLYGPAAECCWMEDLIVLF